MSKIEWTEKTWNPIVGCSIVSPGCTNCYAMAMAARIERMGGAPQYDGTTQSSRAGAVWTGKVALAEKALLEPLKRKKPTTYFVNSMGDLFHEDVPDAWIDRVFAVMALCPQHTFQCLTKRSAGMRAYILGLNCDGARRWNVHRQIENLAHLAYWAGDPSGGVEAECERLTILDSGPEWPLPNVWLGVSAEDQTRADERIPDLLATPAAIRFVSAEPLLGPIDLTSINWDEASFFDCIANDPEPPYGSRIDWVIVGGESGKAARPMHPDWARSLRDQCADADVPFFFKQWGEWKSISQMEVTEYTTLYRSNRKAKEHEDQDVIDDLYGETCTVSTLSLQTTGQHKDPLDVGAWGKGAMLAFRIGKARAGRTLDSRTHDGMPSQGDDT